MLENAKHYNSARDITQSSLSNPRTSCKNVFCTYVCTYARFDGLRIRPRIRHACVCLSAKKRSRKNEKRKTKNPVRVRAGGRDPTIDRVEPLRVGDRDRVQVRVQL